MTCEAEMGNKSATGNTREGIDSYAISLTPTQTIAFFGCNLRTAKSTLTWGDVVAHPTLTLRKCVDNDVPVHRLHKMQPCLQRWVDLGKVTLQDYDLLSQWRCEPFTELQASIGDLVLLRSKFAPLQLANAGVTYTNLRDKYGLTTDLMRLLRYSTEEWCRLGFELEHLNTFTDEEIKRIFQQDREAVRKALKR